jgi:hypothetical protein
MEQEITYFTSEAHYNSFRNDILKRLKAGEISAQQNPINGPTKIVETTVKIGIS